MNNRRLTLLTRARMSVLSAIRHSKEPCAETSLRKALGWIDTAKKFTLDGLPAEIAMENAITHLKMTSVACGFATYLEEVR